MTLPISESAVPNKGKVGNQVLAIGSRFDVLFFIYLVHSNQSHPHQASLAKSECAERWS